MSSTRAAVAWEASTIVNVASSCPPFAPVHEVHEQACKLSTQMLRSTTEVAPRVFSSVSVEI